MLRATGHAEAAAQLETTEFSVAMEAVQSSGDASSVPPLLAAEDARIADAVALAEVLAPLLASRLAANQVPNTPTATLRPTPVRREPVVLGSLPSSPTVADFIDGMLAQDRTDSRPN